MSQTLCVNGKMYEANTVTLSDEELKGLLCALEKDEDEDFWEDNISTVFVFFIIKC